MKKIPLILVLFLVHFSAPPLTSLVAQHAETEVQRPVDRVVTSTPELNIDELTKPFVEMGRKSFPPIIERFNKGLPEGEILYVTVQIIDQAEKVFEQIFLKVGEIEGEDISGTIASEIRRFPQHKMGDPYQVKLKEVRDWTITKPDGSEEGNVVGKFLDVFQDRYVPIVLEMVVDEQGKITSAKFAAATNRYKQDVSFCISDAVKREAEVIGKRDVKFENAKAGTVYTYIMYDYHEQKFEPLDDESEK